MAFYQRSRGSTYEKFESLKNFVFQMIKYPGSEKYLVCLFGMFFISSCTTASNLNKDNRELLFFDLCRYSLQLSGFTTCTSAIL